MHEFVCDFRKSNILSSNAMDGLGTEEGNNEYSLYSLS
jgi:hypothetical protein